MSGEKFTVPGRGEVVLEARQQAAVAWLVQNVFTTSWIIDPEILSRLENNGVVERVRARQVACSTACSISSGWDG